MPASRTESQITLPFPDNSMPGVRTQESGGRIINSYLEPLGPGAPSQLVYRRAPGLGFFGTSAYSGFRGGMLVGNNLYCAFGNNLVSYTSAGGAATQVGAVGGFSGTAKGFFARNNLAVPDMVFVDPGGTQISFTAAGAFTSPISGAMPAPNSVCAIDGFFVFTIASGTVFASDYNSLTVNALSFGTADSRADTLIRGIPWAGNLFLFGTATIEVWANVGASPFPFQRSVVIPRGIAGPYCVAGFEDNFSRVLIWVADDNTVVRMSGYVPEKISPPDLDGLIEDVTNKSELEMSVYISRGHAFVMLSSLTWTWVFDLNNEKWAERQSYLRLRSRITGGVYAFGKWLCGDTASGNINWITDQRHTEINPNVALAPEIFRWRLESGAVENFPVGARVGRADFNFVTGVGKSSADRTQDILTVAAGPSPGHIRITVRNTSLMQEGDAVVIASVGGTTEANGVWTIHLISAGIIELVNSTFVNAYTTGGTLTELSALDPIETDPVVEISWSDDGGQTYYAPLVRQLGTQSQTKGLVSLVSCTGRSSWNGRRWRIDVADPVHVGFLAGSQNVSSKVTDIG